MLMVRRETWVDGSRSRDGDEDRDGSRKDGSDGRVERVSLLVVESSWRSRGSLRVLESVGRRSWNVSGDESAEGRCVGVTLLRAKRGTGSQSPSKSEEEEGKRKLTRCDI